VNSLSGSNRSNGPFQLPKTEPGKVLKRLLAARDMLSTEPSIKGRFSTVDLLVLTSLDYLLLIYKTLLTFLQNT
jgi:hypothetical protein